MMFNKNKKAIVNFIVMGFVAILGSIGFVASGVSNVDINDNIITQQQMQDEMLSYLESINFTANLYNTYYNETYLNKTFIDNKYYQYETYSPTFNDYLTQITNIFFQDTQPIDLNSNDIISLNANECSEVELYFKDSFVNAITDNNGLNISSQLSQVVGTDIDYSFFILNDNNIIENNLINFSYDYISHDKKALKLDNSKTFEFSIVNDTLQNSNIYFNWASEKWDLSQRTNILNIYENNSIVIKLSVNDGILKLENLISNEVKEFPKLDCQEDKEFCLYELQITPSTISLLDSNNFELGEVVNSFSLSNNNYIFKNENLNNKDILLRSLFINNGQIMIKPDLFNIKEEQIQYDRNEWTQLKINFGNDDIFYQVGNYVSQNQYNKSNYNLTIDTTKTSISNAFCTETLSY